MDKERLTEQVKVHITEFQPQLDMVETKCYAKPKYTEDSKEVQEACDAMNKYVNASITYPMNEPVVVDKALISQWLQVDGEMKVSLNTEARSSGLLPLEISMIHREQPEPLQRRPERAQL